MSTAMLSTANSASKPPAGAVVRRFVWKEFRTLRGLWIGVAVLGALILWAIDLLSPPSSNHAAVLLATALATAVLYAVGAAAMTFSLEHEESTYDFLLGLPLTWGPLYLGKVSVVTASAVALAACLSVIGWTFSGFELPGGQVNVWVVVALFGIAILEGIAWGTLFSLLIKRPIVAAILTLVMASTAVNLAVLLSSSRPGANLKLISYAEAAPLRLAIVAIAMLCSVFVARRWLIVGTAAGQTSRVSIWHRFMRAKAVVRFRSTEVESLRAPRRAMLARLLWQTWRDSWKLLLLPIAIATVLGIGIVAGIVLAGPRGDVRAAVLASTALFVPALYGALAFSNDQRRRSYRFLAEHAARPRYVWLARHIVWLDTLLVVSLLIWLTITLAAAIGLRAITQQWLDNYVTWGVLEVTNFDLSRGTTYAVAAATLAGYGILAAYGLGQFCSMLLRSEILAAFLALVLSVVMSAWLAVLFAWQLSGWLFVLPIAAALLWATWLRAPDWIAERNSWLAWLKAALPVVATLAFVGIMLPSVRLAQVARPAPAQRWAPHIDVDSLVETHLAGDTSKARETAAMYLRAVELLNSWEDQDPFAPWQKPEYLKNSGADATGEIDEAKIPPDQRDTFLQAKEQRAELIAESQAAAVKLAMEASVQPTCRFDFDVATFAVSPTWGGRQWSLASYPVYTQLNKLLAALVLEAPAVPFDRLLAALRMSAHLSSGQPAVIYMDQLVQQEAILEQVALWAAHDGRTSEELAGAIDLLTTHVRSLPWLTERLIPDHLLVGDVVRGKTQPLVLAKSPESPLVHLAYLANQLPWERVRGLLALERITQENVLEADQLASSVSNVEPRDLGSYYGRHWFRPRYAHDWPEAWLNEQPAAATSYLARLEYQIRAPVHEIFRAYCDNQVYWRAALVRIALARYRLDHGHYPDLLTELVPGYLQWLPMDPYSGQHFAYRPDGLELPLQGSSGGSNFERIEADTPLFWSVGAGHARLMQWNRTYDIDATDPQGEPREMIETVYRLSSDEPLWSGEPAFAFPLPK